MEVSKIYLSPVYDGTIRPVILHDGETEVAFYMLPFIKPSVVLHYAEEGAEIKTYNVVFIGLIASRLCDDES